MKPLTEMDPNRLQDHVLSTYITLRTGIAIITLAWPLAIFLAGLFSGVELQGSISAYYWADEIEPNIPRTVFIGGIFAVASGLYLYKGFTAAENIALNLAAVLAMLVALVPMGHGDWNPGYWHGSFAIAMFVLLVYVVWFRAGDTLKFLNHQGADAPATTPYSRAFYQAQYKTIGLVMLVSPVTAAVLEILVGHRSYIFFIESAAIVAFGWYWLAKSSELKRSSATRKAAQGKIAISPASAEREHRTPFPSGVPK